jgi:hypothetical protein
MQATYFKYQLQFKQPSGTSRGVLTYKDTWFIQLEENGSKSFGECGMFRGLSIDDRSDYEGKLQWVCQNIHLGLEATIHLNYFHRPLPKDRTQFQLMALFGWGIPPL